MSWHPARRISPRLAARVGIETNPTTGQPIVTTPPPQQTPPPGNLPPGTVVVPGGGVVMPEPVEEQGINWGEVIAGAVIGAVVTAMFKRYL